MSGVSAQLLLVHGEERHLIDRAAAEWRRGTASAQMDVEVFDAPAQVLELERSLAEVPLLDPVRSILVRDPPQLLGAARRGGDSPERLAAALRARAPSTSVCLVAHGKVAAANPVLAEVRAQGGTIRYFPTPRGRDLRSWLDGEISARGLRLGPGAAEHLLREAGSDLGVLSSELDKLVALAGGRPLTIEQVRQVAAGDAPVEMWSVVDQLLGPEPARGAATVQQLLDEGRSSQHLLSILAGQLRDLLLAQAHLRTRGSAAGLAALLRAPDWRVQRLLRQARLVPATAIAAWLRSLHDADRRIKAGEIGDSEALLLVAMHAADGVVRARRSARANA